MDGRTRFASASSAAITYPVPSTHSAAVATDIGRNDARRVVTIRTGSIEASCQDRARLVTARCGRSTRYTFIPETGFSSWRGWREAGI
mmetsp:Transcript_24802/g.40383  ORF Transcript_24802/g.40383 Transcript_24802/m.40383 type:complete len:88 (+) Transcript_24802:248-511(+)